MLKPTSAMSQNSDNQSRGGVSLPRINSGHSQRNQEEREQLDLASQPIDNPFFIPEDYEIFKMKEKEKEIRRQERIKNANLKIWDKGKKSKGAISVGKLNDLCRIDEEQDEDYTKLNIVDAAKSAIKNRVRQKEPIHQFLDKKREMLLFQMLIDHKREQINQFEELTRLHRRGLEKSEQMLEDDLKAFNSFLEENKNKSRQTIKDAEDETKKKQERINEIKQLQELKADLTTKNTQKIESLEEMLRYKKFLDQITPKDQLEKAKKKKEIKKAQKRITPKQIQNTNVDKFQMNISKEIQDFLDDSDEDFETYFEQPKQLEDIFSDLEEKNLFLIFNTKETEQKVEEIKKEYEEKKERLNQIKKTLQAQKQEQLKQLEQINEQIRHLKQVKGDNEAQQQLEMLESEIFKIYKAEFLHDRQTEFRKDLQGIEILKEMEDTLDKCIQEAKMNRNIINIKEKDHFVKKRQQRNNEPAKQEQQRLYQENQQRIASEQKEKRYGRPIMAKSILKVQEKKEEEEIQISSDSIDESRYFS